MDYSEPQNHIRLAKNIIMTLSVVALGVAAGFTIANAATTAQESSATQQTQGNFAPDSNKAPSGAPSENGSTPPSKPDDDSSNSGNSENSPPEPPNGTTGNSENTPPEPPSNDNSSDRNTPPSMSMAPQGQMPQSSSNGQDGVSAIHVALFSVEAIAASIIIIYLLMSNFNKKSLKETFYSSDKILIYILSTIVLSTILFSGDLFATKFISQESASEATMQTSDRGDNQSASTESTGATTITNTQTISEDLSSENSDESVILVKDGGNATISGTFTKSGDSTNTESSEFYGVNAAILVTKSSTATIKNATIKTSAKGANAVFSTGEESKIYISDSIIESTGSSSARGLDATYGGYIEGKNLTVTTQGGSCATLATDRGEGTVIVSDSKLETNGSGSPVIYSTGNIQLSNSDGTANGSQMVVIEGKNSATITSSNLTASAKGNRGDTDQAGVMIYQSMSGDASEGTGTFTAKNSNLTIPADSDYYKTAPMFFITNTDAVINLTNTTLNYGSNTLISAKGTDQWGSSGKNGGNLTFNATNETLKGNIEADNISTLSLNLSSSNYTGTINGTNTAKSISLTIDSNSKITLTGDSYVTSFSGNKSNINFNGHKLYVNGTAIN